MEIIEGNDGLGGGGSCSPPEPVLTTDGQITASGSGARERAYLLLLSNLARSGVILTRVQVIRTGFLSVMVQYTVQGTQNQFDTFTKD